MPKKNIKKGKSEKVKRSKKPIPQGKGEKRTVSKTEETVSSTEIGSSPESLPRQKGFRKGDPNINRTIPGPGRPKNSFRKKCRRMIDKPSTWNSVRRILKDRKHPLFATMWKEVAAHGHGKAPQVILTPSNPNPENTARFIHEMLEQMDETTTGEK